MASAPQTTVAVHCQPGGEATASGIGDNAQRASPISSQDGDKAPDGEQRTAGPDDLALSLRPATGEPVATAPEWCWRSYPGHPAQVAGVRTFLAGVLADCPAAEDVILMADELASNAVQHSNSRAPGGTFGLRVLARRGESVRVEVADAGGRWARPGCADQVTDGYTLGGRGLRIVEALAVAWGVNGDESGRTVWFTAGWDAR
jgi:serine/threonine-protein kinase RsbW